jgi:hypothetical protein
VPEPNPYAQPLRIAALMSGFDHPWFIAGGWAIDLFLGHIRRPHKDLDFTIFRRDQLALQQHLASFDLKKIVDRDNQSYPEPWPQGEWLDLPIFQVFVEIGPDGWPTIEALFSETEGDEWWWRKNPQVRRPYPSSASSRPSASPASAPKSSSSTNPATFLTPTHPQTTRPTSKKPYPTSTPNPAPGTRPL